MYKKHIILCLMVVLVIPFLCLSVYGSDSDKNTDITKLSIVPAKEPVPALSYRLLPRYIDQKTGNAALFYYSAAGLYPAENSDEVNEKIKAWRNLPFEQLDRKEVEEFLGMFSNCFRQIELAAQRNSCQWEMPVEEGFSMHLPNLLAFRQMMYVLQLKIRLEIADGKIDNAIDLLQQGMYMGRSIAEGPTIIQNLVGISIDAVMLKEVENLIQQSNCPNLYWALSSLPTPLIEFFF